MTAATPAQLGPLAQLFADPLISEVMVNGPGLVWVERGGVLERTSIHIDGDLLGLLVERILAPLGLRADRMSPIVDARLADGSRAHVVLAPLAIDGTCLSVRRFRAHPFALEDLCSTLMRGRLMNAVEQRANILVSGATSTGKTTLLNALGALLPARERVITIEDAAELRLPGEHVVRLEARPPNADGLGEVRMRELVRAALHMRPDRLVVGEVRGGEALDMVQAMNTGHDGCLATCHANSPLDALRRIETLALMGGIDLPLHAVRELVLSAIQIVVQMARDPSGRRHVVELVDVADLVDVVDRRSSWRVATERARSPVSSASARALAPTPASKQRTLRGTA